MNIKSDAEEIIDTSNFEYNLLGLILRSFRDKGMWQYIHLFNIIFNVGIMISFSINGAEINMFTVMAMTIGFIAFTANVVLTYNEAEKAWDKKQRVYAAMSTQRGGSISD